MKPHTTKVACFQRVIPRTSFPPYSGNSAFSSLRCQDRIQANKRGQGAGASPGAFRNFCRNVHPCRYRHGFEYLTNIISCANIVRGIQVTVVYLAGGKPADTVIVIDASFHFSGTVERQRGCIPCAYMGHADSETVGFACHHALDFPAFPQMQIPYGFLRHRL